MFYLFLSMTLFFSTTEASEKFSDLTCEQLIEKSADKKFALSTLAGLRAHKKCPDFKYEWRNISGFEKYIYSEELLEIDPSAQKPLSEKSIDELRTEIKTEKDPAQKFKLYKNLRQKYKNAGQRDESKRTIKDLYDWTHKSWKRSKRDSLAISQYLEASLLQARVLWNADQIKSAKDLIKKINSDLRHKNLADSYFLSGKLAEDEKDISEALKSYDLALKAVQKFGVPAGSTLDINKLSWTRSWLLYRAEKWTEAEASLRELSDSTTDLTEKTRSDFFRSRTLVKLGKPEESKLLLKNIIQKDFYSYYALASSYLLNENLPAVSKIKSIAIFTFDQKLSFLDDVSKNIFDALIKYDELEIAEKAVIVFSKNNDQNVNLSLYLAKQAGRYIPLFSSFAKLSNDAKMDVMQKYPELVFPRPHESEVKKISQKIDVPKSLIYSIMKQESGFNLKSRSHADAYGLMQLIPRLAKSLAKKYEVPYQKAEDLYDPEINIPLGSYELRDQIKKQNGQLTFVAAAYNAGPGALAGWLKTRPANTDMFDFIESIPFDETRMYVKIITRNKLFYERFEKPDVSHPFPAEFVKEIALETVSK